MKFLLSLSLLAMGLTAQDDTRTQIDYFRFNDQRGINVFETGKKMKSTDFNGLRVRMGAHFTQQLQSLSHETGGFADADLDLANDIDLAPIGTNFNTATANWTMDVQLERGVRVHVASYLSSRHHPEFWVKGGYIQFDEMGFLGSNSLDNLFKYVSLKVGHFEVNYGDQHFRRTDNGNAIYNPFVGNYIIDAFTTEIGAEVYGYFGDFMVMGGFTNGEIKGDISKGIDFAYEDSEAGDKIEPAFYTKLAYDSQINDDLRVRGAFSYYSTEKSANNTLFWGDRTGSRYYLVMSQRGTSASSSAWTGRLNPGMRSKVAAMQINGFVKFQGFEFFGTYDSAMGRAANETEDRELTQVAVEGIYRLGEKENVFLGARFNQVDLEYSYGNVKSDRIQVAAGWFLTQNVLAKLEYVSQNYTDFPSDKIEHEGKFNGIMFEAVVGF